ncbi:MAG: hypothetical protein E6Q89_08455 [Bacteroidia bacterium]|nr:MAG: hypothetical protein E6Q89_08455 [Bacteroidia bacterium]
MIAYTIFIFLLLIALLRFVPQFRLPGANPWVMPIGFTIKFAVGLFFIYVYSYHYGVGELTADASAFLHDSKELNKVFYTSPSDYFRFMLGIENSDMVCNYLGDTEQWDYYGIKWFNDSRNILRLHSIIHFFSFGYQSIHLLIISLISILGLRLMVLATSPYFKTPTTLAFFALLLMPSALFWSSGILKEPLIYFSLGLFLYAILGQFSSIKKSVMLLLSALLLLSIKFYLVFCIIPGIIVYQLFKRIQPLKKAVIVVSILTIGALLSLLTPPLKPVVNKLSFQQYDFMNIGKGGVYARADTCIYVIYNENLPYVTVNKKDSTVVLSKDVWGEYTHAYELKDKRKCLIPANSNETPWKLYYDGIFSGSYVELTPIYDSSLQLLLNIPEALENTFLRPYFNDPPHSIYKYFTMIDNYGLLLIFIIVLLFFRRKLSTNEIALIAALVTFSFVLALLIGWTTPVLGAIVRYKVPIQLALMLITIIVFDFKKVVKNG